MSSKKIGGNIPGTNTPSNMVLQGGRRTLPFMQPKKALEPYIIEDQGLGTLEIKRLNGAMSGEVYEFTRLTNDPKYRDVLRQSQGIEGGDINKSGMTPEEQLQFGLVMTHFAEECALIIIRYRLDPEFELEDVKRLPQRVIIELSKVLQQEVNGAAAQASQDDAAKDGEEADSLDPTMTQ